MKVNVVNVKIAYPELRGTLEHIVYPAFVEPKFDGELSMWTGQHLINKYGKTRCNFPAADRLPSNCILLGELYYNSGKKGALYEFLSHKTDEFLQYVPFDILQVNKTDLQNKPLVERREIMFEVIPKITDIIAADLAMNKEEAMTYAQQWIQRGFEGATVKSLQSLYRTGPCDWVKIKEKDRNIYVVELIDPVKERIQVTVPTVESGCTRVVSVGVKCPLKHKQHLHVGQSVEIEHQGKLPSGSLRHPVFIGIAPTTTSYTTDLKRPWMVDEHEQPKWET